MQALNNSNNKREIRTRFKVAGFFFAFLMIQEPITAFAVQIYKENEEIYYSPFSKNCTELEVKQFIEKIYQKKQSLKGTSAPVATTDYSYSEPEQKLKDEEYSLRLISCGKEAVPAITNLLRLRNSTYIYMALSLLKEIGTEAEEAVPALIELINKYPNGNIKCLLVETLAALGPAAKDAGPVLISLLNNGETCGNAVISALGNIGPVAKDAIPELIKYAKNDNYAAVKTLVKIGAEGVVALVNSVITDKRLDKSIRFTAINSIDYRSLLKSASKRELETIIASIIAGINDDSIRFSMVALLGNIGKHSEHAASALAKILETDPSVTNQLKVAEALKEIGKGAMSVPALIRILEGQQIEPAAMAAEILGSIGQDAFPAIPALIKALKPEKTRKKNDDYWYGGREWSVEESAATALSEIGAPAVPYMIHVLSDQTDRAVRARAALALGQIGKDAQEAIPYLIPFLQQDKKSQLLAAIVLAEIGAKADIVLPILTRSVEIENYEVRARIVSAIGKLGKSAASAVPALIKINATGELIEIGDATAHSFLMECIKNDSCRYTVKEKGSAAMPVLIESLQSTDADMRHWAASVLGKIGKDAVPALLSVLQKKDSVVRRETIYALGIMENHPVDDISSLERILHESTNKDERRLAASVLDMMGHDVGWFFNKNNLVSPSNAVCPLRDGDGFGYDSSFDFYTGRCLVEWSSGIPAMGALSGIIRGLADFFSNDEDSDNVVQEAHDAVKQK